MSSSASSSLRSAFGSLLAFYRPELAIEPITDEEAKRHAFWRWRWRMFAGMFLGYFVLYFCRKNISNAIPLMGTELDYTNTQLGLIGTALYVTYGIGKFTNGVLADRSNIRRFMATGLILSGCLNLVFGSLSTLWLLALVWGLNGWFQSMGFPPIARGMTIWFPPKGKSTRWAFWTCSHQAGTAAIMGLTAVILMYFGWRWCFYIPAALCIAMGLALLILLADNPESKGLPQAKAFEEESEQEAEQETEEEYKALFVKHVLKNRNVWVVGIVDLCVYVVRYGTLDWTTKFMIEAKGYEMADAALRVVIMPLAGVVGVLASGVIADVVFKARYRMVNLIFIGALGLCLWGFAASGPGTPWLDLAFMAGIGFFVEGPQSILGGVGAVDAGGSARVASSAAGLVGILAYFGASLSGVGSGWFIDTFDWMGAFGFWIGCCVVGLLLCAFVWKERSLGSAAGH